MMGFYLTGYLIRLDIWAISVKFVALNEFSGFSSDLSSQYGVYRTELSGCFVLLCSEIIVWQYWEVSCIHMMEPLLYVCRQQ